MPLKIYTMEKSYILYSRAELLFTLFYPYTNIRTRDFSDAWSIPGNRKDEQIVLASGRKSLTVPTVVVLINNDRDLYNSRHRP